MLNTEMLLCGRSKYSISTKVSNGGSASVSPQGKQYAGTLITVTCSPSSAYQFSSISIVKQDGSTVSYTTVTKGSKYTFVMPSGNVTVNVNFSLIPTYSITLRASGGSIRASKTSGIRAGEKITLTLTPNAYYGYASLSSSPSVSFGGSGNSRTFTMPSSNITITATFPANFTHIITGGSKNEGSYRTAGWVTNEAAGYSLGSINTQNFNGYTLIGIYSNYYSSMRTTDAYVIFRNKPPYPRLRLTVLETGQSVEMTNSHRNGYGRSNDAPFTFGFSANTHIKLEFLS